MRYYYILNLQHVFLFVIPTLLFIILFAMALGFKHFWTPDSERQKKAIVHGYADGLEGRNASFPLAMLLILIGTVLWAIFYILITGWLGVKI